MHDDTPAGWAVQLFPSPATIILNTKPSIHVSGDHVLAMGELGELYVYEAMGGPILSVIAPGAWATVHAGGPSRLGEIAN